MGSRLQKDNKLKGGVVFKGSGKKAIPLELTMARVLASSDIPNTAAIGGLLSSNTAPTLTRTTTLDPSLNVSWAASSVTSLQWHTMSPVDMDPSKPLSVKLMNTRAGNTDTCKVIVNFYEGVGGSDLIGGTTAALTTLVTTSTFTIAAGSFTASNATPKQWNVVVTPAAHGNDAIKLTGAWIEYPTIVS